MLIKHPRSSGDGGLGGTSVFIKHLSTSRILLFKFGIPVANSHASISFTVGLRKTEREELGLTDCDDRDRIFLFVLFFAEND